MEHQQLYWDILTRYCVNGEKTMQTRYEKYENLTNKLPFVLNVDIIRTPISYSEKQNWHDNIEIQLCTKGRGVILIDGKEYSFCENDIAIIGSNSIHYTFSNSAITYSCIIVSTGFCEQMNIDYNALSFYPIVKDDNLRDYFLCLCEEYKKTEPMRVARLNSLLLEILIKICDSYSSQKKLDLCQTKNLNAIKQALFFIRENYNRKISLGDISKFALIDKYTLCKEFKKFTGQTVFDNLNSFRCTKAADLILSGKSVSDAAFICGFENLSFFTKTFKKYMHETPSAYKKRN